MLHKGAATWNEPYIHCMFKNSGLVQIFITFISTAIFWGRLRRLGAKLLGWHCWQWRGGPLIGSLSVISTHCQCWWREWWRVGKWRSLSSAVSGVRRRLAVNFVLATSATLMTVVDCGMVEIAQSKCLPGLFHLLHGSWSLDLALEVPVYHFPWRLSCVLWRAAKKDFAMIELN